MDRIFEGSLLYGRDPPDYSESTSRTVKLFIPRGESDKRLVALISEEQKRTGSPLPLYSLLVLNVLKNNHRMSLADMSRECAIPESKLKTTLERLTESGLIDAMGSGRGRAYVLSAKAYKNPIQHVWQTDIDAVRYKELVMTLARRKEYITRGDVIELLHVSSSQAYRLLKKLVEGGLLALDGTTSAAKYTLKK